ncbi:MAG: hypothetical protein ACOYEG_12120 [Petrimonas sp.]|jgi:hypothetical protein
MILDEGKMERMFQKFWDSPCNSCKHSFFDTKNIDTRCPHFKEGVIPDDIISGKNKHTSVHPLQIGSVVYEYKPNEKPDI